jgi:hypothetical protein
MSVMLRIVSDVESFDDDMVIHQENTMIGGRGAFQTEECHDAVASTSCPPAGGQRSRRSSGTFVSIR